ncbi:transposase family protein [Streptomyces sp. NPDC002285]
MRADEPYYSQKHKKHGMNVQVITRPDGTPLWFSRATPDRTHDLTAGPRPRHHPNLSHPPDPRPGRPRLPGCRRYRPYYHHRELPEHYQQYNRDHARLRAPDERAFARLKSWRLLQRARCSTHRIGKAVAAAHTLSTRQYPG